MKFKICHPSPKNSNQITLQLALTVTFDMNGETEKNLVANLHSIVKKAAGEGMMTSDGPAEVEIWDAKVTKL